MTVPMGLFNKLLHAGEGKKLKSLESIVPVVGAFEHEIDQAWSDDVVTEEAIDTALMSISSASAQRTSRFLNTSFWWLNTTAGRVGSGWA